MAVAIQGALRPLHRRHPHAAAARLRAAARPPAEVRAAPPAEEALAEAPNMTKTRIDSLAEWQALVSSWIEGVSHPDPEKRTTVTLDELVDALRVDTVQLERFRLERGLSHNTVGFAEMLSKASMLKPVTLPCVVIWRFITIDGCEDCGPTFLEASIQFVTREELK